jgi:hypothetical protein
MGPVTDYGGVTSKLLSSIAKGAMTMFFRFAKANCCNYSPTGPGKMAHYCWLEPKASKSTSLLSMDKPCPWFTSAVLPPDQDLQVEWERLVKSDPNPLPGIYRICRCGKRFKAASNRQLRCTKCAKEQARASLRKRVRHHRESRALL